MPGKAGNLGANCLSPRGSRRRLGREGTRPRPGHTGAEMHPGGGWGGVVGVPVSSWRKGPRAERQVTSGHVGVGRGPSMEAAACTPVTAV